MKNQKTRRHFLRRSGIAALGVASLSGLTSCKDERHTHDHDEGVDHEHDDERKQKKKNIRHNPIGVSTYSFWQFNGPKESASIESCIEKAARMGFDGIELLLVQMTSEDNAYLQKLKKQAYHSGLDLCGFSTHQGFLRPDKDYRKENIEKTIHQIELAYNLGIPTMRLNTGRWGTSENFDALMANRGIEPSIEGYTDEDGYKWVIDAINECMPTAEKCGVVLGLENHWGLGRTAEGVKRIVNAINSPWLMVTLDTGNFFRRSL